MAPGSHLSSLSRPEQLPNPLLGGCPTLQHATTTPSLIRAIRCGVQCKPARPLRPASSRLRPRHMADSSSRPNGLWRWPQPYRNPMETVLRKTARGASSSYPSRPISHKHSSRRPIAPAITGFPLNGKPGPAPPSTHRNHVKNERLISTKNTAPRPRSSWIRPDIHPCNQSDNQSPHHTEDVKQ